jgi:hypothetical protein
MIDSSTANIKEEDPLTRYGKRESNCPKKKRKKDDHTFFQSLEAGQRNRSYFLRFRFRFRLSIRYGSGSGSDFNKLQLRFRL